MEPLPRELASFDVVRSMVVNDSTVVIVGEHHESEASASLVSRAVELVEPDAICIEASPTQWRVLDNRAPSMGGEVARQAAASHGIPLYLIDEEQEIVVEAFDAKGTETEEGEARPPSPDANGDIDEQALSAYRRVVMERQPERYEVLWRKREKAMRGRLRSVSRTEDTILCVVGASHLEGIVDCSDDESTVSVEEPRIVRYD